MRPRPLVATLLGIGCSTAILSLCSRIDSNGYWLDFIGLVPWLIALETTTSFRATVLSAWTMCMAFVLSIFSWFGFAIANYTQSPSIVGLGVLVLSAPLLQPQFLVFAGVRWLVGQGQPIRRAFVGAAAWVATEWIFPKLLGDTLAHGLYPSELLRQLADLSGTAGITFLLLVINSSLADSLALRRSKIPAITRSLLLAGTLVACMFSYGSVRLAGLKGTEHETEKRVRIGLVQANIVSYEELRREKGTYDVVRYVLDTHFNLSQEAIDTHHVDALVWSETVYPTTFAHPRSDAGRDFDREIVEFVERGGVPLLFGSYDTDEFGEYNAAVLVEPGASLPVFYRKTNLFFLTEYVPSWLDLPLIRSLLPWAGTWKAGSGPRLLTLHLKGAGELPLLPLICLDDVDTDLALAGARLGARLILAMSNDSWFSQEPAGAHLHLVVSAFRSIETRLPQLRVTANGISAVIDNSGTVLNSARLGERRLLVGDVANAPTSPTLVVSWGNWVGRGSAFAILLWGGVRLLIALKQGCGW